MWLGQWEPAPALPERLPEFDGSGNIFESGGGCFASRSMTVESTQQGTLESIRSDGSPQARIRGLGFESGGILGVSEARSETWTFG